MSVEQKEVAKIFLSLFQIMRDPSKIVFDVVSS
jgi:hypothetical protein